MAGLLAVLWHNWGLFWDPFLWLVYGLLYGSIRDNFGTFFMTFLWLVCGMLYGLIEDYPFMVVLWLVCGLFYGLFVVWFGYGLWSGPKM